VLLTLQTRSNAKHTNGHYSWGAISQLVQRLTGQAFNYETFQANYDSNPALQNIVADFNDQGVTLNVNKKDHDQSIEPDQSNPGIDASAKQAAKNTLQRNRG